MRSERTAIAGKYGSITKVDQKYCISSIQCITREGRDRLCIAYLLLRLLLEDKVKPNIRSRNLNAIYRLFMSYIPSYVSKKGKERNW